MGSTNMGLTYTRSHHRWPATRREGGVAVHTSQTRWGWLRAVPDGPWASLDPEVACRGGRWSRAGLDAAVHGDLLGTAGGGAELYSPGHWVGKKKGKHQIYRIIYRIKI
jgi:hypothetical protein